jgi:small-conductance mechanosensitive channel
MRYRHYFLAWALTAFAAASGSVLAQTPLNIPGISPSATPAPSTQSAPPAPAPAAAPPVNQEEMAKRANQSVGADIQAKIAEWQKRLDAIEEKLREPKLNYNELNSYRDRLIATRTDAEDFWSKLEVPLDRVQEQVQKLPALPAQGQPPESEQAAMFRAELMSQLSILNSARSVLDNTQFRINQLLNTIQDIRRKNFTNNLFQYVPGVFSAQTWDTIPKNLELASDRILATINSWWQTASAKPEMRELLGLSLLLCLVLNVGGLWGVRRLRRWYHPEHPPFWRRASSAAGVILLRALPQVLPIVFLYNAVAEAEALPQNVAWLFYFAARSVIIIVVVNALTSTVLAPGAPLWRVVPAKNRAAARFSWIFLALALVYGATAFAYTATRIVQAPFALTVVITLLSNLLISALVASILLTPLQETNEEGLPSLSWLRALRMPVWALDIAIVVTAFSGYLALSRFLAQQLIVTGTILAIVYLLLLWADGLAQGMSDDSSALGNWLKGSAGLEQRRREQLAVPVGLLLKLAVLILSVPLILLQWGYAWPDIVEWYRQLFFGFSIGNTQISLAAIIASVIVFTLGYFAARVFQGWLDAQVLRPAGLSPGLRDSIRTGVGYAGVTIAALFALSYAGLNLSSLAIVAGAFSVGIGFGLQSVVSNFVSGLILLAERPIKVGDLVVVGGEEGYVRKISVRSTEIETFDRANVLIPNSAFITDKVKNWTLRNNTGRIAVAVRVAYGCDPRMVKALLLKVAQDHPNVMRTPEPFVDLEAFGEDTLDFKLYAFVYDLEKSVATRTDLRIAILDAFGAAGIVIPSRQTDITLKDIDWLRDAVKQYLASGLNGRDAGHGTQNRAAKSGSAASDFKD